MKEKEFTRMADGSKLYSESETRRRLINIAIYWGFKDQLQAIFDKYDRILAKCTNLQERQAIAEMAASEVHHLMDCKGNLLINGKEIVAAKEDK